MGQRQALPQSPTQGMTGGEDPHHTCRSHIPRNPLLRSWLPSSTRQASLGSEGMAGLPVLNLAHSQFNQIQIWAWEEGHRAQCLSPEPPPALTPPLTPSDLSLEAQFEGAKSLRAWLPPSRITKASPYVTTICPSPRASGCTLPAGPQFPHTSDSQALCLCSLEMLLPVDPSAPQPRKASLAEGPAQLSPLPKGKGRVRP